MIKKRIPSDTQVVSEDLSEILRVRRKKLETLKSQNKDPFAITSCNQGIFAQNAKENFENFENKNVDIAGRILNFREMGKASFLDVFDKSGKIQVYVKINDVGKESYEEILALDVGDIISVSGTVFKTRRGEVSVHAREIKLLTKSLIPLPEKYHGLKSTDLCYRNRYLDLIMNSKTRDTFIKRSKIITKMREFLDKDDFLEVETPILITIAGGAEAEPFSTRYNALNMNVYLRIATEIPLKKLLVGGFERVYEIGRIFRNEGLSIKHNPEFTTLEVYKAYSDYKDMMDLTERMVRKICLSVCNKEKITYQDKEIDISKPFERVTMLEAVKKVTGVDFLEFFCDDSVAREKAANLQINLSKLEKAKCWGEILNLVFEEKVEETLVNPTFVYDYPVEVSVLTKRKKSNPKFTERFELFVIGRELANAYSELNDPVDQRERFILQLKSRGEKINESTLDEDFLTALEYGMPPAGGMGMGIDRLVMLLTDNASIRDVLLFPTMKPI